MHPIAFEIGRLSIHWYGILVALGFLVGMWAAGRRGRRAGFEAETILDLGPWLIVGAIIGARIWYVATFWGQEFSGRPFVDVFKVWHGGLVFYGGLVGDVVATVLYARLRKLALWKLADVLAPSIALGYVFGRIGCLLNGCCYGRPCSLPWAIRFPPGNPMGAPTEPVHPTELYEAGLSLCLYAALAWWFPRRRFDGQVFAFYLVAYACLRSFVELFRGDYPAYQRLGGWLTPGQAMSALILVAGLALLKLLPRTAPPRSVGAH